MTRLIHVDSVHEAFWLLLALLEGLIRWFNSLEGEFLERWQKNSSSPPRQDTTSAMCLHQGLEPKMYTTSPHLQTDRALMAKVPLVPPEAWGNKTVEQYMTEIPLRSRFKDPDVLYDIIWCWFLPFLILAKPSCHVFFPLHTFRYLIISSLSTLRLRVFQFAGLVQRNLPHLWRHLREDMMPIWNGWLNVVDTLVSACISIS